MVAKKALKVKFKGPRPVNNTVCAKVNNGIMGPKIGFPHRHLAVIDTGIDVKVEAGYKLCFSLAPWLTEKGMVATNAPGYLKEGRFKVSLLNCGREIVELKDGDFLAVVWLEADIVFDWEEE